MNIPSVFISSSSEGLPVAKALAEHLDPFAECNLWAASAFDPGRTIIESLTEVAERSDFSVFVLTPDDVTHSRGQQFHTPRDNLIFELGFLAGRIGISRTIVVVAGSPPQLKMPTDLAGIVYVPVALRSDRPSKDDEPAFARTALVIQRAIRDLGPRSIPKRTDYYSCFISYSWDDQQFASKLHEDLQSIGARVWLDTKDMQAGAPIHDQINRAIQAHDKVLLVLSNSSVRSSWVSTEINNALKLEEARHQTILFPVRLDDSALESDAPIFNRLREKYILDFSDWKDDRAYQRAFSRLVRDLAISKSVESGGRD